MENIIVSGNWLGIICDSPSNLELAISGNVLPSRWVVVTQGNKFVVYALNGVIS